MNSDLLYFNGVNGATGGYELPPMSGDELAKAIKGEIQPENLDELRFRQRQKAQSHYGVKAGVDPKKLRETGWGIIFAHDAEPAVQEALQPLLDLRREQAGEFFRIYAGADGHRPDETKTKFLARHGAGPGPADPQKVPYYLLIVGSPERIPYRFQYQLDVQYAVGRIHFETAEDYANYARSVVEAESGKVLLPREIGLFGVANPDDQATLLSAEHLLGPIAKHLQTTQKDWRVNARLKEQAAKSQLAQLLGGTQTPALLFTASHGMAFPKDDPRQQPHQGALLCQDWPGPQAWQKEIPQDFYFAGDDLDDNARLLGLMSFHFACYGAGTPYYDDFAKQAFKEREAIAPHAFVADLPRRLLSHPKGGALAAVGHVDRAWGYSFLWEGAGAQTTVFTSAMDQLLAGYPVGAAIEYFNERYAELSSDLSSQLEEIEYGKQVNPYELAGMWTANNDARSYIVFGDPAVRLPVADRGAAPLERPALELYDASLAARPEPQPEAPKDPKNSKDPKSESRTKSAPLPSPQDIDYGLLDMGRSVTSSLKNVSQKLTEALSNTMQDLSTLEVRTYTCDDLDGMGEYDRKNKKFSGEAKLQAYTRIELDGDSITVVPRRQTGEAEDETETPTQPAIDKELWEIHKASVQQAQQNRESFFKALLEIPGTLMKTLR
ncbi:MAG: hypothetical protein GY862_20615 [Gammaproteobacteria bacterium]|nr:hypothetical protein [Gammaproteobacteria bacterium]